MASAPPRAPAPPAPRHPQHPQHPQEPREPVFILPHNIEAEIAVLGSVLIDPEAIGTVAGTLKARHFYRNVHQEIFAAMLALHARGVPCDLIAVCDELERTGKLGHGDGSDGSGAGHDLLSSDVSALANHVPTSANLPHYAQIVAEHAVKRDIYRFASHVADAAVSDLPAAAAVEELRRQVEALAEDAAELRFRTRTPRSISLADLCAMDLPEPRWVVPGLLPEGLTLLAGKPKSGKSWLALDLALAVAYGGVALGQTRVEPAGVLYLALEDTKRRLRGRTQQIRAGQQLGPLPPTLRIADEWPRLDAGGLAALEDELTLFPDTRLVIVDTLAKVRPRQVPNGSVYQDDYGALEGLKRIADQHGIAVVVIHHVRKLAALDPFDEISGSTGLTGAADASMVLRRERGGAAATLHITGRDLDDQELGLSFDGAAGAWTLVGDAEEVRRTQRQQAVLDLLRDAEAPLSISEVAERLRGRYDEAKNLLWYLERTGTIAKAARGRYQLPPMPQDGYQDGYTADECHALNAGNAGEEAAGPDGAGGEEPREATQPHTSSAFSTFPLSPSPGQPASPPSSARASANEHLNGGHANWGHVAPPPRVDPLAEKVEVEKVERVRTNGHASLPPGEMAPGVRSRADVTEPTEPDDLPPLWDAADDDGAGGDGEEGP